jgi:hypothetical protein
MLEGIKEDTMNHKYQVWITDEHGVRVGAKAWAPDEAAAKEQIRRRAGAREANDPEVTHLEDDCCPLEMSDETYERMVDEHWASLCKKED